MALDSKYILVLLIKVGEHAKDLTTIVNVTYVDALHYRSSMELTHKRSSTDKAYIFPS